MTCYCIRSDGDTIECGPCAEKNQRKDEGAMKERAAIVKWLREGNMAAKHLAAAIEDGEHLETKE